MRLTVKKTLAMLGAAAMMAAVIVGIAQPAAAAATPSFRVVCYPTGIAPDDPIVFPGQPGASHMHSFYGAKGVNGNTTTAQIAAATRSQCGSNYDAVDLSAYWIPTLYKDGQQVYVDTGMHQLHVYYERAGGPGGPLVAQAFPRGLKMIAGDMRATTPQAAVDYACAKSADTGSQSQGSKSFPSCRSDETLIAKLTFPDCWDGRNLDSADHKSHMAYSDGNGSCGATHPVKLPQIIFEAWFFEVNGPASSFSWASGGAFSFHGDVISMWDPRAAANLVNQCINVAVDCNPLQYTAIPTGTVTQAQIDAQFAGTTPPPAAPPAGGGGDPAPSHSGHDGGGGAAQPTATATPDPTASPDHTQSASHSPSPSASRSAHSGHGGEASGGTPSGATSAWSALPLVPGLLAILVAIGTAIGVIRRRRRI